MKRFLLLVSILILSSCSSDDEGNPSSELNGSWVLDDVSCFCFFGDDFDFSQHSLDFDVAQRTVAVNNGTDTFFIVVQSGVYDYEANGSQLTINNGSAYIYEVNQDRLTLTFVDNPNIADDEITLFYNRN